MPWIDTSELTPESLRSGKITKFENDQIYCGLDSAVGFEILDELNRTFNRIPAIYNFERAMQAPYLEIMQRGFRVDEINRRAAIAELDEKIGHCQIVLDEFANAVWDKGLNPRSPKQLIEFFYGRLRLPEQWISVKGEKKLSTNREVLEKLDQYLYARPFVSLILTIRELSKQREVFTTEIDPDGRFRSSYNIAGTETGRPSSSENAFGTGRNAQNIAGNLRYVFVADPGWKLCVIDLEQVEARDVGFFIGNLFGDWNFLDNCESGDLHTNNCKLVWPGLPWTGDKKRDREIADGVFYRDFSYRDMSKRGGHLTNYYGTAFTMARSLKIPQNVADEFQARYAKGGTLKTGEVIEPAFPGIARWWQWTAEQLQTTHSLLTPFGRERHFFGRPGDDTTLREAIAFLPQSTTADRMNLGLWRVWRKMPQVQLMAQTYDSITFQFQDKGQQYEDDIVQEALQLIRVELKANNGRSYIVPGEAKVGWNWGSEVKQSDVDRAIRDGKRPPRRNPEGLRKWKLGVKEDRVRATGLNRIGGR
jgi:DNA polymerase I-like protein with 3'-5' exonuclease and polymerase domains